MKLYTGEQVIEAMKTCLESSDLELEFEDIVMSLKPIELPSDEDIESNSPFKSSTFGFEQGQFQGFIVGAKWLKSQILKQIKP